MSDGEEKPKKGKGMLFGIIGALLLGGGGGFAAYSGMIDVPFLGGGAAESHSTAETHDVPMLKAAYVQLDPIVVDFGRGGRGGRLRVSLTIETTNPHYPVVDDRKYRIVDTLYSFLRAVKEDDLRNPAKTDLLRSRILRRVLLETPPGTVSDVLISEIVIL